MNAKETEKLDTEAGWEPRRIPAPSGAVDWVGFFVGGFILSGAVFASAGVFGLAFRLFRWAAGE